MCVLRKAILETLHEFKGQDFAPNYERRMTEVMGSSHWNDNHEGRLRMGGKPLGKDQMAHEANDMREKKRNWTGKP